MLALRKPGLWLGLCLLGLSLAGGRAMSQNAQTGPVLIPRPQSLELAGGTFTLTAQTQIQAAPVAAELQDLAQYLKEALAPVYGGAAQAPRGTESSTTIELKLDDSQSALGAEGYTLLVTPKAITLNAPNAHGIFNAIQTLRQLLPDAIEKPQATPQTAWTVPCLKIQDQPRFARRGLLLDVGRHFYSVAEVKRLIDLMTRYKMNLLHWHLTEDQGWRIEIKKYPKLTEVGAWRKGENNKLYPEGKPQGGFYTQAEVREIVAYAAKRFVTVVPEIEMPGHAQAALASYPALSCTGGPYEVSTHWGVHKDVFCAGNDQTVQFLKDVLTEVMDLFPAKEIHIGGDECPKDRWKACPKCQARMKAEGLKDEKQLQSWFMKQITAFLNQHGRRALCWDEVLEEGLREGIVVQEWRGHKPDRSVAGEAGEGSAAKAAHAGLDTVISPQPFWYLDMPMKKDKRTYTWGRPASLAEAYGLEPMPQGLDAALAGHILGGEGCIWTEHLPPSRMDYFTFPRALAIAEVLWSPAEGKQFDEFYGRVKAHYPRLELMGVNYGPAVAADLAQRPDPGEAY